ncbi:MAG: hypothetical protein H6622_07545 [Halobacteriovoraceae bacterium]|nr:hypothetical protein [Halobacteriovoraceae bacterium]
MVKKSLLYLVLGFYLGACGLTEVRPKLEMSLAAAAFLAAQKSDAQVRSPGLYRKAETYYLKAKSSYRRKFFNKAKQYAELSRKFSERAEFIAKRKETLENY